MRTEEKARREAEILEAARRVFAADGFTAATMDRIALEAGVAKGTLYLYFPGKDEIFWAAVRGRFVALLERTREETATAVGARDKIRAAVRVRFAFLRADEAFLRIYLTEFGHFCRPSGQFRQRFRELYLEGTQVLADILDQGVRAGEVRPLPTRPAAMALLDLSRDVFAERFLDPGAEGGRQSALDDEQFVFDLFWNGVAAAPPRTAGGGDSHA